MGRNAFEGFTLGGVHSSALHVVRTNEGSDFSSDLVPSTTDKTAKADGKNGTYYFGRDFKTRSLSISIAYDNMTESELRQLQNLMKTKTPMPLVLDETPYKTYYVVPSSSAKLNYVCYETGIADYRVSGIPLVQQEQHTYGRVYKGTGTLGFTLYDLYGYCSHKFTNDSYYTDYKYRADDTYAIAEWNDVIKLKADGTNYDTWDSTNTRFKVYNPGDVSAKSIITIPITRTASAIDPVLTTNITYDTTSYLTLTNVVIDAATAKLEINNELELIRGLDASGNYNGIIYNAYITNGYFFGIPVDNTADHNLVLTNTITGGSIGTPTISYNYLFW